MSSILTAHLSLFLSRVVCVCVCVYTHIQVDQAILREEDRVVIMRFGHDWDETCMRMDEVSIHIRTLVCAHTDRAYCSRGRSLLYSRARSLLHTNQKRARGVHL